MMLQALLLIGPLLASGVDAQEQEDYATLHAAFEQGLVDWNAELKQARKEDRADEVRARHPAKSFYPRFAALDSAGDGRALLWMALNADDAFDAKDEVLRLKQTLWRRVVAEHATAEWADEIGPGIAKQRRWLEDEGVQQGLMLLSEKAKEPEVIADALARVANMLDKKNTTPEQKARAKELRDRIAKDYPGTLPAIELQADAYREQYLSIGKVAPDFEAVDVEGVAFKLSDYRGKVVLLDFWGFW
jgi:hypothetical protein